MEHARVIKSTITYNSAISAGEKCGKWAIALSLLEAMFVSRVDMDTITGNAAMSACEKGGEWAKALE